MIEYVHKHITSELQQNTRTDTIFIITSIALNLIILAVNSGFAPRAREEQTLYVVMILFVVLLVLINLVVVIGLLKGKQTRSKLVDGLLLMYKDQQVDKYYDTSLLMNYNTRYNLFMMVVVLTGLTAIAVPFLIK